MFDDLEDLEDLFEDDSEAEDELFGEDSDELGDVELGAGTCPHCGLPREELEASPTGGLVDVVTSLPTGKRRYGPASSYRNPTFATDRCTQPGSLRCPDLTGIEQVSNVNGVPFEYIGGSNKKPGISFNRTTKRWSVVERNRQRGRKQKMMPRVGDALAAFLANMNSVGLPVQAILTMGSVYCRCISKTNTLSNHSYGDAIDIGGFRLTNGTEVLVANHKQAADLALLHRANACLRLSFATVLDYYEKRHWNHFHCDTNQGRSRRLSLAWWFVRKSLGLPVHGKPRWSKQVASALVQFAGSPNAAKDPATLNATLSQLFMREAARRPSS
jgi:hypothetical protein